MLFETPIFLSKLYNWLSFFTHIVFAIFFFKYLNVVFSAVLLHPLRQGACTRWPRTWARATGCRWRWSSSGAVCTARRSRDAAVSVCEARVRRDLPFRAHRLVSKISWNACVCISVRACVVCFGKLRKFLTGEFLSQMWSNFCWPLGRVPAVGATMAKSEPQIHLLTYFLRL